MFGKNNKTKLFEKQFFQTLETILNYHNSTKIISVNHLTIINYVVRTSC